MFKVDREYTKTAVGRNTVAIVTLLTKNVYLDWSWRERERERERRGGEREGGGGGEEEVGAEMEGGVVTCNYKQLVQVSATQHKLAQ